jgi:acyl-coenzyme A thioesterase PaaI-like protein
MNKFANVSFTTALVDQPDGVTPGGYLVTLINSAGAVADTISVASAADKIQFIISTPGDYTVGVARVAVSGENISATVVSAVFNVAVPQMDVPTSITVTLSDVMDVPASVAVA